MRKLIALIALSFAAFSAAACQSVTVTEPCDVLPDLTGAKPETNTYLVDNDMTFARKVAVGLERYRRYDCGGEN